ncbi:MAG: hypothetical protein E6Q97_07480 [Desulfurellales bacterium]|nr:MAG: hypothetical protein E6Q97_07480 [Desulfurellales bacterium]
MSQSSPREQIVRRALDETGQDSARNIRAVCPFCVREGHFTVKRNLSFNKTSGWWSCWRCNKKGRFSGYASDGTSSSEARDQANAASVLVFAPPQSYIPIGSGPGASSPLTAAARRYAAKRHLSPAVQAEAYLGMVLRAEDDQDFTGRLIIPVLPASGDREHWLGWIGRDFTGRKADKYKYPVGMSRGKIVYNEAALHVASDKPVLVVEGALDVLPFWPDGIAVLGTYSEYQIGMLAKCRRPILVALDGDAWDKARALVWYLTLAGHKNCGWIRLPPKKDPDEMVTEIVYSMEHPDTWTR